jgi:hypothetical protein
MAGTEGFYLQITAVSSEPQKGTKAQRKKVQSSALGCVLGLHASKLKLEL